MKEIMSSIYELTVNQSKTDSEWDKLKTDYPKITRLNLALTVTNSDISQIKALWSQLVYVYVEHIVTNDVPSFPKSWKIKSLTFGDEFNQSIVDFFS